MSESSPKRRKIEVPSGDQVDRTHDNKPEAKSGGTNSLIEDFSKDLRLTEHDVGITEYISKHKGFHAILKQRYSDFIVHEISEEGELIKLTDFNIPPESMPTTLNSDPSCLTPEDQTKLQELLESKDKTKTVTIKADDDKALRTHIHQTIRQNYPGLESSTVEDGLQKHISVKHQHSGDKRRSRWPQGRGDYCRFVLYKENKDTMDALNLISKLLRGKPSLFSYAGTKDRRAKTSQEITAFRVPADSLKDLNKTLRNMAVGNFSYCTKPLQLGQLKGNRFTIILREVTGEDDQIEAAMKSLAESGFINYYGMQRFGTQSVPTHHIGRALLSSQWQKAVELILQPRHEDDPQMSKCRKVWWETRDAKQALALVGRRNCIEQSLLQGLKKSGENDYTGALNMLPRNTRTMYVHSYQSYVWNSIVSRRLQKYGLKPIVGDLVLKENRNSNEEQIEPTVLSDKTVADYDIEDVVFPLPGYDVIYPNNEVSEWYLGFLKKDGLDIMQLKHKTKDYSLAGAYRSLIVKPSNLTWSCQYYDDVTIPLVRSDLDLLQDVQIPNQTKDGKYKALLMELTLPTSCYATMAVRDVLKTDTSSAFQSTLNPVASVT